MNIAGGSRRDSAYKIYMGRIWTYIVTYTYGRIFILYVMCNSKVPLKVAKVIVGLIITAGMVTKINMLILKGSIFFRAKQASPKSTVASARKHTHQQLRLMLLH